jgi:hypothetical protein
MKGTLVGSRTLAGWPVFGVRVASRARASHLLEGAAFSLLLLLAIATRAVNLEYRLVYPDDDEGIRGVQLLLMQAGFRPLGEIYASQGPLLLDLLFPLYQLYGGGLEAARLAVASYSLLALVGTYWVGRQVGGPLGALAAALFLVLSPIYLDNSRRALAEAVALGPAVLAVGAALIYARLGQRRWLMLAAALLGLSLLVKPITASAVVPVGLAVFGRRQGRRDLLTAGLVVVCVVLVGSLAVGLGGCSIRSSSIGCERARRKAGRWGATGSTSKGCGVRKAWLSLGWPGWERSPWLDACPAWHCRWSAGGWPPACCCYSTARSSANTSPRCCRRWRSWREAVWASSGWRAAAGRPPA